MRPRVQSSVQWLTFSGRCDLRSYVDCLFVHLFINSSVKSFIILSNLEFKLFDSLCHSQHFFLEGGFVSFQIAELLLESLGLSLLVAIMSRYFFDNSVQLIRQRFSRVLAFHGKNGLKRLLFGSKNLDLLLVYVQILCELPNYLIQVGQFAFQVRSIVLSSSCGIHSNYGESRLLESIALVK